MTSGSPLRGVRVNILASTPAAAFCGHLLGQLGAEVLRFDLGDEPSTIEDLVDRPATRSIRIDSTSSDGLAELRGLAFDGQVFVTDLPIQDLQRLGLHWGDVHRSRHSIVYVRVSSFGSDGPLAGLPTDDLLAQSMSGLASMVGFPDREPLAIPYNVGLREGGMHAAAAATAALLALERTGEGAFVDIAVADVLAALARNYAHVIRYYNVPVKRAGRRAPGSAGRYPLSLFPCMDGYVVITVRSSEQWRNMIAMLGHPDWSELPRYQDEQGIAFGYPQEVDDLIVPWMMQHTRNELMELGSRHGVMVGSVRTLDEVLAEEQFAFRGFLEDAGRIGRARVVLPGFPAQFFDHDRLGERS